MSSRRMIFSAEKQRTECFHIISSRVEELRRFSLESSNDKILSKLCQVKRFLKVLEDSHYAVYTNLEDGTAKAKFKEEYDDLLDFIQAATEDAEERLELDFDWDVDDFVNVKEDRESNEEYDLLDDETKKIPSCDVAILSEPLRSAGNYCSDESKKKNLQVKSLSISEVGSFLVTESLLPQDFAVDRNKAILGIETISKYEKKLIPEYEEDMACLMMHEDINSHSHLLTKFFPSLESRVYSLDSKMTLEQSNHMMQQLIPDNQPHHMSISPTNPLALSQSHDYNLAFKTNLQEKENLGMSCKEETDNDKRNNEGVFRLPIMEKFQYTIKDFDSKHYQPCHKTKAEGISMKHEFDCE